MLQPTDEAMRWLAGRVAHECDGFGKSEEDVLRTLLNRGIECSYVKNRKRLFRVPGESMQVYASEVIRALQEEVRKWMHSMVKLCAVAPMQCTFVSTSQKIQEKAHEG